MNLLKNNKERDAGSGVLRKWQPFIKRQLDILLGILLVFLLSPLFLYISILIFKKEGKPIFHRESCVGRKNRSFTKWKFRTLSKPSRLITAFPPYPYPGQSGRGAPRTLTATGRWLKKYKFEELPLLINIIRGDMSFTGPKIEKEKTEGDIVNFYGRN